MTSQLNWQRICRLPISAAIAALAVRLILMFWLYHGSWTAAREQMTLYSEAARVAGSLASGHGFSSPLSIPTGPTAWVTPVYASLLAGVFRIFGLYTIQSAVAIFTVNSLFSALTCIPIFFLARGTFGSNVAMASAWTWVFFPNAMYIPVKWVWETSLATLLLTLLGLAAVHLEESSGLWPWMGFGALWGLAALVNPSLLTVLFFMGGWLCYRLSKWGVAWTKNAAVASVAFLMIIAPWFVRNYRSFGQFIPFRSGFGLELRVGNSLETDVRWRSWLHPNENLSQQQEYRRMGEPDYMQAQRREAVDFIGSHPSTFAWLTFKRIAFIWTGIWSLSPHYLLAHSDEIASIPFSTVFSMLALTGLWLAFRRQNPAATLYALVLISAPLVYYITHVNIRYRHPIDPFVVVLSVYAFTGRRGATGEISGASKRKIE